MHDRSLRDAGGGFSLLELIVATLCTSLLAGAVFSVLVSGAASTRRRWAGLAAQAVVDAAVMAVARDARQAGDGIEAADSIRLRGERMAIVAPAAGGGIRVFLALGPVREVVNARPDGVYEIAGVTGIEAGTIVAAVGLPERPTSAPLPAGVVVGAFRRISTLELRVAWGGAAATLDEWGDPRAIVALKVREYGLRRADGAWQLRRRDGGRTWQPVVDGLDSFTVGWILDRDADGVGDTRIESPPAATDVVCAVVIEATAFAAARGFGVASEVAEGTTARAAQWIRTGRC